MNSSHRTLLAVKVYLSSIPTPSSLSYFWNFGSLLGVCLGVQVVSGVLLTFHYHPTLEGAFESVSLLDEVWSGWVVRLLHANGASFFFLLTYLHIGRGLFYGSFNLWKVWFCGVFILLLLMGTAFLGYVLPWGQMSFWGATVITNLLSALPKGVEVVEWVWGGFSVGEPTLSRFFSLHYLLPFVISGLVLTHLSLLHEGGSTNPLGVSINSDKVLFHPLFTLKDLVGVLLFFLALLVVVFEFPDLWMDPDNFSPANPLVTPIHIQPEWYFLFAYAILRSIPNKLGGVMALMMSVVSLFFLPLLGSSGSVSSRFSIPKRVLFWGFSSSFLFLTYLGSLPAEGVFVQLGQAVSVAYFLFLFFLP